MEFRPRSSIDAPHPACYLQIMKEHSKRDDGQQWVKFLEHWGLTLIASFAVLAGFAITEVLSFFMNLGGTQWILLCAAAFSLMILGSTLIARAKMPLYLSGRFFTFGIRNIPPQLTPHYRWGWRVFLVGVGLSLGLMLTHL